MRQVLFYIPLHSLSESLPDIPLYGYGMMLFLAFILCSWLAGRLARREGVDPKILPDLAIWLFVTGILGGRLTFVIQEWPTFAGNPLRILFLWDGGLVLYGALISGAIGYILFHRRVLSPEGVSAWKMADILAPSIALGIALGRIGCLLTGCCYGNVACDTTPYLTFPLPSPPTQELAKLGYQTLPGFLVEPQTLHVTAVEPGSAAAAAGLEQGDVIVAVNGQDLRKELVQKTADGQQIRVTPYEVFRNSLGSGWAPGVRALHLTVLRGGREESLTFVPHSLPLHPTQLYETISMGLLLFFLVSYYPFKKYDGAVMVFFMLGYAVHRFLNEILRIDNPPLALGLTFSQLVSVGLLLGGLLLAYLVFVRHASVRAKVPQPVVNTW